MWGMDLVRNVLREDEYKKEIVMLRSECDKMVMELKKLRVYLLALEDEEDEVAEE